MHLVTDPGREILVLTPVGFGTFQVPLGIQSSHSLLSSGWRPGQAPWGIPGDTESLCVSTSIAALAMPCLHFIYCDFPKA